MMLHVQFRLDSHRRRVLEALAESEQRSISELMREAVDALIKLHGGPAHPFTPAEEVEVLDPQPLQGWDQVPTAAGLPVVDDLDDIA